METKISTKGQVVLPSRVRQRLGLRPGDALDVKLEGDAIVLRPRRRRRRKAKIITDPRTGLSVLTFGPGAPILTHAQIKEMLADFP
ncbi:MAG TPA: AbrB/MazE/SpoVT family DNA-binding domain-containing protein [Candidatus Acidoferrum sp.]|nr:AbrB/MazE/SpoVT family DNA-binding domain-containing protein [Candidatus Acidoferrum sp.]